jgi:hypothetical protein
MYFLGDRIDKGGKTSLERFREDLETMGWNESMDISAIIGVKTNVKTRINQKGYAEVAFVNKPREHSGPKWSDNDWSAVKAMLGQTAGAAVKVAGPIGRPLSSKPPVQATFEPGDEDLPF